MKVIKVWVAQSCPILYNPLDCSPSVSSVHGILQAWKLESVAIPFSRGSSWPRDWTLVSCIAGRFLTIWATREAEITVEIGCGKISVCVGKSYLESSHQIMMFQGSKIDFKNMLLSGLQKLSSATAHLVNTDQEIIWNIFL